MGLGKANWTAAATAREWFAVLATAAISAMAMGLTAILWLGRWSPDAERLRLSFLGAALMILLALLGFGVGWLWRVQYRSFEVQAGLVRVSLEASREAEGQ